MVEDVRAEVNESHQTNAPEMDQLEEGLFHFGISLEDASWIRRTKDLFHATLKMRKGLEAGLIEE